MPADPFPIVKPHSFTAKVTVKVPESLHEFSRIVTFNFDDAGQVDVDPNTGSLTVIDRRGLPVKTWAEGHWVSVEFANYTVPGDHVMLTGEDRSWER